MLMPAARPTLSVGVIVYSWNASNAWKQHSGTSPIQKLLYTLVCICTHVRSYEMQPVCDYIAHRALSYIIYNVRQWIYLLLQAEAMNVAIYSCQNYCIVHTHLQLLPVLEQWQTELCLRNVIICEPCAVLCKTWVIILGTTPDPVAVSTWE